MSDSLNSSPSDLTEVGVVELCPLETPLFVHCRPSSDYIIAERDQTTLRSANQAMATTAAVPPDIKSADSHTNRTTAGSSTCMQHMIALENRYFALRRPSIGLEWFQQGTS